MQVQEEERVNSTLKFVDGQGKTLSPGTRLLSANGNPRHEEIDV